MGEVISYTKDGIDTILAAIGDTVTTAELDAAINALVGAAPGTLNTLDEIAQAMGDDPNFLTNLSMAVKYPVNTQTVDYTLAATDKGKEVEINAATGKTVTVPVTPGSTTILTEPFTGYTSQTALPSPWQLSSPGAGMEFRAAGSAPPGGFSANTAYLRRAAGVSGRAIAKQEALPGGFRAGVTVNLRLKDSTPGSSVIGYGPIIGKDVNNYYGFYIASSQRFGLFKVVGGVVTNLATGAVNGTVQTNDVVSINVTGNTITVWSTTWGVDINIVDTTVPDGNMVGFWGGSDGSGSSDVFPIDDFSVSALSNIFAIGDVVRIRQQGAGAVTIAPAGGVTVDGPLVTGGVRDEIELHMRAANAWVTQRTSSLGAMGVVIHGATAGTARPAGYGAIHWIGSVSPTNAIDNDVWTDTSA